MASPANVSQGLSSCLAEMALGECGSRETSGSLLHLQNLPKARRLGIGVLDMGVGSSLSSLGITDVPP